MTIAEKERESGRVLEHRICFYEEKILESPPPLYYALKMIFTVVLTQHRRQSHEYCQDVFNERMIFVRIVLMRISRDAGVKGIFCTKIELKNARILIRRDLSVSCLSAPERGRKRALRIAYSSNVKQNRSESFPLKTQNFRDEKRVVVYKISRRIRRRGLRSFNLDTGDTWCRCGVHRIDVFNTEIPIHDGLRSRRNHVFQLYTMYS